ncbi:MAG: triose-phosphate isomerase family protein [Patescibacteria group bacterium]|nr:triose-phosphate isomerase family protein [Patescibacteria group bacterium]
MKLIVANWKSNHNIDSTREWFEKFKLLAKQKQLFNNSVVQVVITPPHSLLAEVKQLITVHGLGILKIGAQDISQFESGSYTGAISAKNMEGLEVEYVLVGHSERRKHFFENDEVVAAKVERAIQHNLTPILCLSRDKITSQANTINPDYYSQLIAAYEPVEAIGSGCNADPADVAKAIKDIQQVFGETPVLYGGSVCADNVASYLEVCNGVLVGGASLEAESFIDLIVAAQIKVTSS